jgi:hypothetical protein
VLEGDADSDSPAKAGESSDSSDSLVNDEPDDELAAARAKRPVEVAVPF